jgi:5-(carboxyamino)imidazole ribonucleotide synthase
MLTQAAISLGLETAIYDTAPDSPASRLTHTRAIGAWDDLAALRAFSAGCDVVTLENEFVFASPLSELVANGTEVYPRPATLATIQDKFLQKQTIQGAGLPVPNFAPVETPDDVRRFAQTVGYPLVLKIRYGGYDGYGNATVKTELDLDAAWAKLAKPGRKLMAEQWIPFERELAVMVVRGRDGQTATYPVVETVQHNHICHIVRAPAAIPAEQAARAADLARRAVEAVDGVGVFGVEIFALPDGTVVYNEIAPRPHNSGHYTIEGCVTSQFENHIRAVMGWPLGDTSLRAPAAVMVNMLGKRNGYSDSQAARPALIMTGAHVHIYGKKEVRIGRKMGHVTVLGTNLAEAEQIAQAAAEKVLF